jgi:cystathionine beta-synthase
MPDKMSEEKIRALRGCGAKVVVCPTAVDPTDPRSYYRVSERLARETPGGFLANQYHNPSNPLAHYLSTGPELWEQTEGEIDVFVSSAGTGGTISGTGRFLKEKKPEVKLLAVDPIGSIYYDYFYTGKITEANTYLVEGFGEDFLPSTMSFDYVDEVVRVSDAECFHTTRRLVREEGIFAGGSSGGAVAGAIKYAERFPDKPLNMVVIMCDSYVRYLSKIFDDGWMRENGFLGDERDVGTVRDMLSKQPKTIFTAQLKQPVREVIDIMKERGISQLPVLDQERVVGLVNESTVLSYLLDRGDSAAPIDSLIETNFAIVEPTNRLSMVGQFFRQNKVVLVVDDRKLVSIITKIDYIDYVTRKL